MYVLYSRVLWQINSKQQNTNKNIVSSFHKFGNIVTLRATTSLEPKTKSNKRVTLPRFGNTLKVTLPPYINVTTTIYRLL